MSGEPIVICGARESYCECVLAAHGPETPHECDAGCGGSWTFNEAGEFVVVRLPSGVPNGRPRRPDDDDEDDGAVAFAGMLGMIMSTPIAATRGPIRYVQLPSLSAGVGAADEVGS